MSQHGVAKASHVEKRLQRGKLFEKLENQTSFLGKFVQMRVQARPAEQGGQGNLSNAISSKVRDASVSTRIHQKLVICLGRFIDVNCAPSCAVGSREMVSYFSSSASIDVALKISLIKNLQPAIGKLFKMS